MTVLHCTPAIKTVISADTQFLSKLNAIDFGPIVFKLMHAEDSNPMTRAQAENAIKKYKMFLYLNFKYPNTRLVPNKLIDRAWHAHLLDSQLYDLHCLILFKRKFHHFPYFGLRGKEDARIFLLAAGRSKVLFEEHFGTGILEGDFPDPSLCCDGRHSDLTCGNSTKSLSFSDLAKAYALQDELLKVRPIPEYFDNDALAISL